MSKAKSSREASDLTALVNEMIEHWKSVAERIFTEVYPFSERDEFDQNWPKTLDNFFLAETVRAAKLLRPPPFKGLHN
jgi:hypothetical protein